MKQKKGELSAELDRNFEGSEADYWRRVDEANEECRAARAAQVATLTEAQRELFAERAAIMEYEGGMSRWEAESRAMAIALAGSEITQEQK